MTETFLRIRNGHKLCM